MRFVLLVGVLALHQVVQAEDKCQYAADPGHCYHQAGNLKMALQYLREKAATGDPNNQLNLAFYLRNGWGLKQPDPDGAVEWLTKAADTGLVDAQLALAHCYRNGESGCERDPEESSKWTLRAAERNHPQAQFNLALAYMNGDGLERDDKKGAIWLKRAAKSGDPDAQFKLAMLHSKGIGVDKDFELVEKWLIKAAAQHHPQAKQALDAAREQGILRPKIPESAVMGGEADNSAKTKSLETVTLAPGVEPDAVCKSAPDKAACFHKAERWSDAAQHTRIKAEKGDAAAQYNLGNYFKDGKGVETNHTEAALWYSKAAAQGVTQAQFNLGMAFFKGEGVKRNQTHGIEILHVASMLGDTHAEDALRQMVAAGDERAEVALTASIKGREQHEDL